MADEHSAVTPCLLCGREPPARSPWAMESKDLLVVGGGELTVSVVQALERGSSPYQMNQPTYQELLDAAGLDVAIEDHGDHLCARRRSLTIDSILTEQHD